MFCAGLGIFGCYGSEHLRPVVLVWGLSGLLQRDKDFSFPGSRLSYTSIPCVISFVCGCGNLELVWVFRPLSLSCHPGWTCDLGHLRSLCVGLVSFVLWEFSQGWLFTGAGGLPLHWVGPCSPLILSDLDLHLGSVLLSSSWAVSVNLFYEYQHTQCLCSLSVVLAGYWLSISSRVLTVFPWSVS